MPEPEQMEATMIANLKEKTGKGLEDWIWIARGSRLAKHGEMVNYLKTEHGLTHGYANLVVHRTLQSAASSTDGQALIDAQYAGPKASLHPIYQALIKAVCSFGPDVEVAPKKTYISLRRNKQFALIQPSTATRVDVGIHLKGVSPTTRLEASGSFNAMVSHRVRVERLEDVDSQLLEWLRQAYEKA